MPNPDIFVSYSRDDRDRIMPLVDAVRSEVDTIWFDDQLPPGPRFRQVINDALTAATAVIVVWSTTSVAKDFVLDEADDGNRRGVLIPVRIDAVDPPLGFRQLHYADLVGWEQGTHPELTKVRAVVRGLVEGSVRPGQRWWSPLADSAKWAQQSADEMHRLTVDIHTSVRLVTAAPSGMAKLADALREVHATYRAVLDAIDLFRSGGGSALHQEHFAELARGRIVAEVAAKRGHCTAISIVYWAGDGIRTNLGAAGADELDHLDEVFARLGTADGDVFAGMTDVAVSLAGESSALANLLTARQPDAAEQRFADDAAVLRDLEAPLNVQMAEVLRFAGELGVTFA